MSRPLTANPKRKNEASTFHSIIFKGWGHKCYHCGNKATDAAHVISRAHLGPHRYAAPLANGRPLCRTCHDSQGIEWVWPE